MQCTCYTTSLLLESSISFPYILWFVTITVTDHHSNPNPRVLKIENENREENKVKLKFIIFKSNRIARRNLTLLNTNIFYSYNIVSILFTNFGLVIEHRKTKVFHFSKS